MASMTKNDLDGLSEEDQAAVQQVMAELDVKQSQKMFHTVAASAFSECVTSFRGRHLEKSESKCIESVVGKYIAFFQRVNVRFGEEFMARNNQMQQAAAAAAAQQQQQ